MTKIRSQNKDTQDKNHVTVSSIKSGRGLQKECPFHFLAFSHRTLAYFLGGIQGFFGPGLAGPLPGFPGGWVLQFTGAPPFSQYLCPFGQVALLYGSTPFDQLAGAAHFIN